MYSQRLPNILRSLLPLIAAFSFAGCSSGPDIRSDYDPGADFGSYKTYNFAENAGPDYTGYQSFFTTYVIEAVTLEMEQRGYVKSNNPDLIVNFNANLTDKTKVSTSSAPMHGGYYGYRGGHYGAWGGYGYSTQTHVSQYTEGTFNIDLIDARRNQLVWEAVGVGRVNEKKMENLEQTVREAIPVYFSNYPFIAGDSIPSTGD
jgi:hypothetical protein